MGKVIEKVLELTSNINKWNYEYYHNDFPSVSDEQYDAAINELKDIETKYPEYKSKNSPTLRVGGYISESFNKHPHRFPMLSLNNAFNSDDMKTFYTQVNVNSFDNQFIVEPKIDGLSLSVIYSKGILLKGVTRGDGVQGEDVTNNVLSIIEIPQIIDDKSDYLEIRGEVYIKKSTFNIINKERKDSGLPVFANPRNAASGTLRQLDSNIVRQRNLSFFAYEVLNSSLEKQSEKIKFLDSIGFKISPLIKTCSSIDEVIEIIGSYDKLRDTLDYEIDGVVVKVDNNSFYEFLGSTSKFPKWAIAFKLASEKAITSLEDISITIGRTGKVTYNAHLSPVRLAGTTVRSATLHNADYIVKNDIRIGDFVEIKKAGDIIPKVIRPILEKRDGKNLSSWKEETNCKSCGEELTRIGEDVDQYCKNKRCDLRIVESLIYFCSKVAMNIESLGDSIITDFYNRGFIRNFSDIYILESHREEILLIKGYKDKSFNKIIESINKSKSNNIDRLISGLGIKNIGPRTAKDISKFITNLDTNKIIRSEDIKGVGEKIVLSWNNWFSDKENIEQIRKLKELGMNMNYQSLNSNNKLEGKTFVITGKLSEPRNYFSNLIELNGGKNTTQISKSTNYLLAGKDAGSKKEKAEGFGVNIIDEDFFKKLLD